MVQRFESASDAGDLNSESEQRESANEAAAPGAGQIDPNNKFGTDPETAHLAAQGYNDILYGPVKFLMNLNWGFFKAHTTPTPVVQVDPQP